MVRATLLLALLFLSCTPTADADLQKLWLLHRQRVTALKTGDLRLLERILSDDYHDTRVTTKREKLQRLSAALRTGGKREVTFDPPRIVVRGDRAEIVSHYRMRVTTAGRGDIHLEGEERLEARKEGSDWKIVGGL